MFKKMYMIACLGLFLIAQECCAAQSKLKIQPQTFYALVTAPTLDDTIFSDSERLKCFGDINTRYDGHTPLHILVDRSDTRIEHVKALLDCGANINIPAVVTINDEMGKPVRREVWDSHKVCFIYTGETPVEQRRDKKNPPIEPEPFKPHRCQSAVKNYIFCVMLEQKLDKVISLAEQGNKLQYIDDEKDVIILRTDPIEHDWPTMPEDEAKKHLLASIEKYKKLESFLREVSCENFDIFLKVQKEIEESSTQYP